MRGLMGLDPMEKLTTKAKDWRLSHFLIFWTVDDRYLIVNRLGGYERENWGALIRFDVLGDWRAMMFY